MERNCDFIYGKNRRSIAGREDIKSGRRTDVYFTRTVQVLKAKGMDGWVKAECFARRLPED